MSPAVGELAVTIDPLGFENFAISAPTAVEVGASW